MLNHFLNQYPFGTFRENRLIFKGGSEKVSWNSSDGKGKRKERREKRRAERDVKYKEQVEKDIGRAKKHRKYNERAEKDQTRREKRDAEGKVTMNQISMPGTGFEKEIAAKIIKKPKSIDELLRSTSRSLSHLKVDIDKTAKYHKTPYGPGSVTRELEEPQPYYKESANLARERDILDGDMSAEELQLMEDYHESIYQHYLSPAFGFRLKQEGIETQVYDAFSKILRNPESFRYTMTDEDSLEISTRNPAKNGEHGLRLMFEGPNKGLIYVNGIDVRKVLNNDTALPHDNKMSGQIGQLLKRFNSAYNRGVQWDKFDLKIEKADTEEEKNKLYLEQFFDSYRNVPDELKEVHAYMNIDFPKHFIELVEARGLDFELNNAKFIDLKKSLASQGLDYKEITEDQWKTESKLQVMVTPSSNQEGVYVIWTKNNYKNPLVISKEGKIMTETESDAYVTDARYEKILSREYHLAHPGAKEAGDKIGKSVDIDSKTIQKSIDDQAEDELRVSVERKMNQERTLEPLKSLAKKLSPTEFHGEIDKYKGNTEENRKVLMDGIKKLLQNDPQRWRIAGEFYKIIDEKTPDSPKKTPEKTANATAVFANLIKDTSLEDIENAFINLSTKKANAKMLIEQRKAEFKALNLEKEALEEHFKKWYSETLLNSGIDPKTLEEQLKTQAETP